MTSPERSSVSTDSNSGATSMRDLAGALVVGLGPAREQQRRQHVVRAAAPLTTK